MIQSVFPHFSIQINSRLKQKAFDSGSTHDSTLSHTYVWCALLMWISCMSILMYWAVFGVLLINQILARQVCPFRASYSVNSDNADWQQTGGMFFRLPILLTGRYCS